MKMILFKVDISRFLNQDDDNTDSSDTVTSPDGTKYNLGAGYKHQQWLGMSAGKSSEFKAVVNFFLNHGRNPDAADMQRMGIKAGASGEENARYRNLIMDLNRFKESQGINEDEYKQSLIDQGIIKDDKPFDAYEDLTRMEEEGTLSNRLFKMFEQMGEQQHQQGLLESQRAERDLAINQSTDRRRLLDELRNRRRQMLKSGLSSMQIANDEIQSLMMAQGFSNQNAAQFYGQRQQMNTQHAMNRSTAQLNAWNLLSGGLGTNMGGMTAAQAGSLSQQAIITAGMGGGAISPYQAIGDLKVRQ